jgi:hypothetical protein
MRFAPEDTRRRLRRWGNVSRASETLLSKEWSSGTIGKNIMINI